MEQSWEDYRRWADLRVRALNHALEGLPEERVRYHVCWGSWHGPHAFDPELKDVVDLILAVNAGTYVMEQANARHEHEWRVWEEVPLPEGKKLIPGVVTHHTNVVEHPELVAQRLVRLANVVGKENVLAGTDCGFAQGAFIERVHPEIQWAKLAALAEGARHRLPRTMETHPPPRTLPRLPRKPRRMTFHRGGEGDQAGAYRVARRDGVARHRDHRRRLRQQQQ